MEPLQTLQLHYMWYACTGGIKQSVCPFVNFQFVQKTLKWPIRFKVLSLFLGYTCRILQLMWESKHLLLALPTKIDNYIVYMSTVYGEL